MSCSCNPNRSSGIASFVVTPYLVTLIVSVLVQTAYATSPVGWRSDGNGKFQTPAAPIRWSEKEGIAWKSDLPATSLSSPVVAGDCAFVMAEPNRLLCFRVSDGKLLWERAHEYAAIFSPEKTREIQQKHAESQRVRQEIAELEKQLKSAQDVDPNSLEVSSLRDKIRNRHQYAEELTVIPPPLTDATGNTASTPVCDGENVYVVLGNGIVSSHRCDGHLNWIHFIDKPISRHSASPVISGDRLIVQLKQLLALDLTSGKIAWKADTPARNGTPISITVERHHLIVTPAGSVVRSADGLVLAKGLFDLAYSSPIAQDNVIYAAERGRLLAIRLSPHDDEKALQSEVLWQTRGAQEDRLASPVVHEGLLFSATGSGILDIVDASTGKIMKRKRMELGEGRIDASLTLANNRLYIQSTNGKTVILEPTIECPEVARNESEGSSSSPFFTGERILFRTPKQIICITGTTTAADSRTFRP